MGEMLTCSAPNAHRPGVLRENDMIKWVFGSMTLLKQASRETQKGLHIVEVGDQAD